MHDHEHVVYKILDVMWRRSEPPQSLPDIGELRAIEGRQFGERAGIHLSSLKEELGWARRSVTE
jgi:hypothetical protein